MGVSKDELKLHSEDFEGKWPLDTGDFLSTASVDGNLTQYLSMEKNRSKNVFKSRCITGQS